MQRQRTIDLNADLGEGFGPYRIGDDLALLDIVTSANVACGFHAGEPAIMFATFQAAKARGVAIGAHPGFEDRAHFGRRPLPLSPHEIEQIVAYQVGAACGMAALAGHRITYVKVHGALSNIASVEEPVARAIAKAIRAVDPSLVCLSLAGTAGERGARAEGLISAAEVFADRAYNPDGTLVARGLPGAVLDDAATIAARVLAMLEQGGVIATDGTFVPLSMDSICVHGDTPHAVGIVARLRQALAEAGHQLAAFAPVTP